MKNSLLTILTILLLTACSGNTAKSLPTELVIQHSPGARYLQPVLQACSQKLDPLPIVVKELPVGQLDALAGDLTITLIEPSTSGLPVYLLGTDQLVLVTRSPAPVGSVAPAELAGVFRGFLADWQNLGAAAPSAITIIGYLSSNELQGLIDTLIIRNGTIPLTATRVEDTTSALALVTAIPGSLSFIPDSQLTDLVAPISIMGTESQMLSYPILAQTRVEPGENIENLMLCIQDEIHK